MFKNEVMEALNEELAGKWTTVRDELADIIKEAIDFSGLDFVAAEVFRDAGCFGAWLVNEDGEEAEVIIEAEQVCRTWYIKNVR